MIEFLPAPPHVLAFRIEGTLTAEDYDRLETEVDARLARPGKVGVYCDMTGFADITAAAAGKDLRYSFGKIALWGRFPRNALVTDKQWLRTLVRTLDPLIPGVEARAFDPSEKDAALAWVAALKP